ncbi:hypothetical protein [Mycobacterium simiae]|nr:hypothetical protein X011_22755 [Mycobacterium tuberculosis variant microti OV254]BBX41539.1 hypothetical protein MSIM_29900 [Mycobacterium simiae]
MQRGEHPVSDVHAGLLFTWLLVAVRTAKGSLRGNLLKLPPSTAPVKASKQHAPRNSGRDGGWLGDGSVLSRRLGG